MKNFKPVRLMQNGQLSKLKLLGIKFFPRRAFLSLVCGVVCLFTIGCRGVQPIVSSSEIKNDSTVNRSTEKESTSHIETVNEKTIPESNVDLILWNMMNMQADHKSKLDSIALALKNLPKGVPQVITIPDKVGHAQIKFLLDSIGNLHFICTSNEKKYYEKHVQDEHYKSDLITQITKSNNELREAKAELLQLKKPWYQKLEDAIKGFAVKVLLVIIIAGIFLMIFRGGWAYLKKTYLKLFP